MSSEASKAFTLSLGGRASDGADEDGKEQAYREWARETQDLFFGNGGVMTHTPIHLSPDAGRSFFEDNVWHKILKERKQRKEASNEHRPTPAREISEK